jgi:hypothetical protein
MTRLGYLCKTRVERSDLSHAPCGRPAAMRQTARCAQRAAKSTARLNPHSPNGSARLASPWRKA